ncbi:M20/M25/M40 family metallo-hydrolase [Tautonia plasticadhaerens]|uniref:Leupeptin-inactivating enzyme 1 n=1 Tax=Tautonia plasticadhaerens TaxID=2527974 RepID=A0A518GXU2_9BACT|nr:M20/M25/M40 family metallo-hydrolase [Tautonia plasticadhaerens]QDV33410.1 Leupeptin-inactivating enzyme 1 precursor [Tautonia plasticadhaerens]
MRTPHLSRAASALSATLVAIPALAGGPPGEPVAPVGTAPAAGTITEPELFGHISFLASDLMRGRDTASPEIKIASEYLATRLLMFGAEPSGDVEDGEPTYFAHFPLEFTTPELEGTELTLSFEHDGVVREVSGKVAEDFLLVPRSIAAGEIEAPVVFAGFGRTGEGDEPNDFDAVDVEDRIVIVLDGASGADEPEEGRGRRGSTGGSFSKLQAARDRGALALLVVHPFGEEADRPYAESNPFALRMFGRRSMTLGSSPDSSTPLLFVEDALRDAIDEAAGLSEAPSEPRELEGARARFAFAANVERIDDRNVIGIFPGADEDLRDEVIIFSAHYDHVGVVGDEIHNGSDDNASGTSALLEIAQAFGEGPRPRRSVAFLWVSGEEKGLLGSRWWSEHMTLPEGYEVVADINMDMVSRNDPDRVSITPSPDHPDYSTIIPAAVEALEAEGMQPDYDADQFYARTDSYNFARMGIPIVFFFSGLHDDYHRPGDDVEKADVGKAARIARSAYRLGWALGQQDDRPSKIESGDPEPDAEDDADPDQGD